MHTRQAPMFTSGQDTPLISGTPMTIRLDPYDPGPMVNQLHMGTCPICLDTGTVTVNKRGIRYAIKCTCPIGQKGF